MHHRAAKRGTVVDYIAVPNSMLDTIAWGEVDSVAQCGSDHHAVALQFNWSYATTDSGGNKRLPKGREKILIKSLSAESRICRPLVLGFSRLVSGRKRDKVFAWAYLAIACSRICGKKN